MARILGVTPPTVNQWCNGDRQVPAERCPDIERATAGAVTCEELRPDLAEQWAYLRSTGSPVPKDQRDDLSESPHIAPAHRKQQRRKAA